MASLNRIEVIGNLTSKPELKSFDWGEVCTISVATNYKYKKKDGEEIDEVEFFDAKLMNGAAKFASSYGDKGKQVRVVGRLVTERWEDTEGNEKSKRVIKVDPRNFDDFMLMGNKIDSGSSAGAKPSKVDLDELELGL